MVEWTMVFRWWGLFVVVVAVWVDAKYDGTWLHSAALPCVYESRLSTDKNWFGFLANITFGSTGRLTFEFSYPVERCCQNVLFYTDQQITAMSDRNNCWQREYLLNPEEEQILRLTPKFSWSGCHMTHPNDVATYVCKGGRSFIREGRAVDAHPTTWYIALSNCATLTGLELTYRIEAYGQVGECPNTRPPILPPTVPSVAPSPRAAIMPSGRDAATPTAPSPPPTPARSICRIEGNLNVSTTWHGFIANISLGAGGGGFSYRFSYPYHMQVQNVILYGDEDMARLGWSSQCWQKEGVIKSHHVPDKILDLSFRATWNGCASMNSSHGRNLICQGKRTYDGAKRVYVAVSNCRSTSGLLLSYTFDVFGYDTDMCSGSWTLDLSRTSGRLKTLSIALIALISGSQLLQ